MRYWCAARCWLQPLSSPAFVRALLGVRHLRDLSTDHLCLHDLLLGLLAGDTAPKQRRSHMHARQGWQNPITWGAYLVLGATVVGLYKTCTTDPGIMPRLPLTLLVPAEAPSCWQVDYSERSRLAMVCRRSVFPRSRSQLRSGGYTQLLTTPSYSHSYSQRTAPHIAP